MTERLYYIIIFSILTVGSCRHDLSSTTKQIYLNNNGDTDRIVYKFSSGAPREVIYYKNNLPDSNVAFHFAGDTLTFPTLITSSNFDSSYVFIPIKEFKNAKMLLSLLDSTRHLLTDTLFYDTVYDGDIIRLNAYPDIDKNKAMAVVISCESINDKIINIYPSFYRLD